MKTIGLARIGRDPEIRTLQDGTPILKLAIAFNYGKKGQDGNRPTQWIDASLFGDRGSKLAPFLTKGSSHCFTLSEVHIQTYTKKDGGQGASMVARIDDIELGPRQSGEAPQQRQAQQGYDTPRQLPPAPPPAQSSSGFDDMDDDIPF